MSSLYGDIITLKDGRMYAGKVIVVTEKKIMIKTDVGRETFLKSDVRLIEYAEYNFEKKEQNKKVDCVDTLMFLINSLKDCKEYTPILKKIDDLIIPEESQDKLLKTLKKNTDNDMLYLKYAIKKLETKRLTDWKVECKTFIDFERIKVAEYLKNYKIKGTTKKSRIQWQTKLKEKQKEIADKCILLNFLRKEVDKRKREEHNK